MGDFSILADRIKELRAKLGMTQREFSTKVGCTAATLSAYENGSKSPSLEIIKGIAEKCNVSLDWLCGLSDKKTSSNEITSYSDIIEMLLNIEKHTELTLLEEAYDIEEVGFTGYPEIESITFTIVRFDNYQIRKFLEDWNKMKRLHDDGSIDDEVYSLWVEKTLLKYRDQKTQESYPTVLDELPFDLE